MSTKIVLIGAGSAMFGLGTLGDIFREAQLEGSTIVLHDINPQTLKATHRESQMYIEKQGLKFDLIPTTDRKEAVQDADFCIISIEVGDRYALWEQDWKVPLQYGIHQVYGENGGPGGFFHAMRIIPPILNICEDIAVMAPEAMVINLSNPMIRISHSVLTLFPDLRYVGLCHEIAQLVHHLPILLGIKSNDLAIKAGGLNHFSVLVEATHKDTGEDLYPIISDKGPEYFRKAENYFGHLVKETYVWRYLSALDICRSPRIVILENTSIGLMTRLITEELLNSMRIIKKLCYCLRSHLKSDWQSVVGRENYGGLCRSSQQWPRGGIILSWLSIFVMMV